jgi:hypothetical protein|tara:strand:- start:336 stop:473 length:138 start_codon:yes stop_codon:yes gene_type:complete
MLFKNGALVFVITAGASCGVRTCLLSVRFRESGKSSLFLVIYDKL